VLARRSIWKIELALNAAPFRVLFPASFIAAAQAAIERPCALRVWIAGTRSA
jgi:hypothetical protein